MGDLPQLLTIGPRNQRAPAAAVSGSRGFAAPAFAGAGTPCSGIRGVRAQVPKTTADRLLSGSAGCDSLQALPCLGHKTPQLGIGVAPDVNDELVALGCPFSLPATLRNPPALQHAKHPERR